jgi:hypothetical protein
VFATSYESAIREAQFDVPVIPNQGAGGALPALKPLGVTSPRIFFNPDTTEDGRDALGWYHEKKSNDDRKIGLGPNHDWISHAADGFGLMCIHYDQPDGTPPQRQRYRPRIKQIHSLEERLANDTERLLEQAKVLPLGPGRSEIVRRITQNKAAIQVCEMLRSPRMQSTK